MVRIMNHFAGLDGFVQFISKIQRHYVVICFSKLRDHITAHATTTFGTDSDCLQFISKFSHMLVEAATFFHYKTGLYKHW